MTIALDRWLGKKVEKKPEKKETFGPGISSFLNKIICGDCREVMRQMPSESVDLVIFSPPYWGLRDYGEETYTIWGGDKNCEHEWETCIAYHDNLRPSKVSEKAIVGSNKELRFRTGEKVRSAWCVKCGAWYGQLGLEPHPQMYIEHMVEICREIKRILKKTGSMYIVIGDTYYGKHGSPYEGTKYVDKKLPARALPLRRNEKTISNWLQPKQLMLIPARLAIALQEDGWILRNDIIWYKCLAGSTPLFVKADGMYRLVTLRELYEKFSSFNQVYVPTINMKGETVWVKVKGVYHNGNTETVKIVLTNGNYVITTLNHRFPVLKGSKHNANAKYFKMHLEQTSCLKPGYHLWVQTRFELDLEKGSQKDFFLVFGLPRETIFIGEEKTREQGSVIML